MFVHLHYHISTSEKINFFPVVSNALLIGKIFIGLGTKYVSIVHAVEFGTGDENSNNSIPYLYENVYTGMGIPMNWVLKFITLH